MTKGRWQEDDGGGRWGDHLPPQIHQKFIRIWNNSYKITSKQQQKTQTSKKMEASLLEWGRTKDKDIKRDKEFHYGAWAPRKGGSLEVKFPCTRKHPHRWSQGGATELGMPCNSWGSDGKTEKITTEMCAAAKHHFSASDAAHKPQPWPEWWGRELKEAAGASLCLHHRVGVGWLLCKDPGRSLG